MKIERFYEGDPILKLCICNYVFLLIIFSSGISSCTLVFLTARLSLELESDRFFIVINTI